MTTRYTPCDQERLRLLLASELPPELETEATEHVAECSNCRQNLESLAGDQDWWKHLKTCFSQNAGLNPASRSSNASHTEHLSDSSGENESFSTDFAVEFLRPSQQPETLGMLNDIEILGVIDRGGMGVVLKGYQRELGRYVAVKMMAPHLAASGSARQRFAREARAAAAIVHPHVMPIHSVNASNPLPYLVMPFVACESLQQRLDRDGPLELKEILRISRQAAAGLAAAHAQGLVHRDVKPANILLEKGVDRVMLTDFGLARAVDDASLTRTGVIAGTPQFMSPEQGRGDSIDARSDLFSLGSVMYAMCTGHPPFRAETSFGVLQRICDVEPRAFCEINPDLPEWLMLIVKRLHEKNPAERFQSAAQVAEILDMCLSHEQQPTTAALPEWLTSVLPPQAGNPQRKYLAASMGVIGAVFCLVVGLMFFVLYRPATQQSQRSPAAARTLEERGDGSIHPELKELQGEWTFVSFERSGEVQKFPKSKPFILSISGDRWVIKIGRRVDVAGHFVIDNVTVTPKRFAIVTTDGPQKFTMNNGGMPLEAAGIYEISDDGLQFCVCATTLEVQPSGRVDGADRPANFRPTQFKSDGSKGWVLYKLRRVKADRPPLQVEQDPGEWIYNDQLKRFKFQLEKVVVSRETAEQFWVRYTNRENPPIIGVWDESSTNSLIIIGPPEAEQAIRNELAQWEVDWVGLSAH